MRNKKGFTLIELIVSLVLVSIVLLALIGSLLQLRNAYTVVHENSDVIVYTSSVARVINSDINDNNGIRYVSCELNGKKCSIILGNNERRELEITDNNKTVNDTEDTIEHSNNKTTLKYYNTSKYDKTNNENDKKLLYIRTLELDKYENNDTKVTTANGYNFYDMSASQYEYSNASDNNIDSFTTITIRLLDGINMDVSNYNIVLYGAGRYDYSKYIGRAFKIDLDNDNATTAGTTSIDALFGVGYYKAESAHKKKDEITKIEIPTKVDAAFLGYYYKPYGVTNGRQIIDAGGNIVADARIFKNDVILNEESTGIVQAKWGTCGEGFKRVNGACVAETYTVTLNKDTNGKICASVGTEEYTVGYRSLVNDVTIPQCVGYTFDGYLDNTGKKYHDETGQGIEYYDKPSDSTFKANWHTCSAGEFSPMTSQSCTSCVEGSYAENRASGSCTACGNGKTTSGVKSTSCNTDCPNNNDHVASWVSAVWHDDNTVTNNCVISTCKKGYDGELSSNKCTANYYNIAYNLNGGIHGTYYAQRAKYDIESLINNPTREGYAFAGWTFNGDTSTARHGSTLWSSQSTKVKDIYFKNLTPEDEATVTLTANWEACPQGYYNDGSSTTCSPCESGTYNEGTGNSTCVRTDDICGSGEYFETTTNSCEPCPAGYYCPTGYKIPCSAGTYTATTGRTSCDTCSAGSYNLTRANTSCDPCPNGYYCSGGTNKTACPVGYKGRGLSKTSQANGCEACPAGTYSDIEGSTTCESCSAGTYNQTTGNTSCDTCPNGYYCTGGSNKTACPAGYKGKGTGKTTQSNGCDACPAGTYSDSRGSETCDSCPSGTYSENEGSTSCTGCPAGYKGTGPGKTSQTSACTKCLAGTYSATEGSATCSNCSRGYFNTGTGNTNCDPCPNGTYSENEGSTSCTGCPPGYKGKGTAKTTQANGCSACENGTYSDSEGSTTCSACPPGKHNVGTGNTTCVDSTCEAGKYLNTTTNKCELCPAGYYCPGGKDKYECLAGTYSDTTGKSSCDKCPAGKFNQTKGNTSCDPCPNGTYAANEGSTSCSSCPAGSKGTGTGKTSKANGCSLCSAGTYSTGLGNTTCTPCSAGTYTSTSGHVSCSSCVTGSYNTGTGNTSCTACNNGKTTTTSQSTTCDINCSNNNSYITGWANAVWNSDTNEVDNLCKISSCKTGYDGEKSSNICTANSYNISYDLDDGSHGSSHPTTAKYGQTVTISNPKKAGYAFIGWTFNGNTSTAYHGSTLWNSRTTKVTDTSFKNLTPTKNGTVTLTAHWSACTEGYYNDGTSSTCLKCSAGTYSNTMGSSLCSSCSEGYYNTGLGNTSCSKCPLGSHNVGTGNTTCIPGNGGKDCDNKTVASTIPSGAKGLYKKMADQAYLDNVKSPYVTSCSGVNFNNISSNTNGKGVYEIASTKDDAYPIYYYRGEVTNNNVLFGGFCWKAVRTTDTGGVKLVYNGSPNSSGGCTRVTGEGTQLDGAFNTDMSQPVDVGYMYETSDRITPGGHYDNLERTISSSDIGFKFGKSVNYDSYTGLYTLTNTITSTSSNYNQPSTFNRYHYTCFSTSDKCLELYYVFYIDGSKYYYIDINFVDPDGRELIDVVKEKIFINNADSVAKQVLENWFESNMKSYTSDMEDTVYCNDRSATELSGWNSTGSMTDYLHFSGRTRVVSHTPSLSCSRFDDRFTLSTTRGNGKLKYQVGLLTADEVMYAGACNEKNNTTFYLYTDQIYLTITPWHITETNSGVVTVDYYGKFGVESNGISTGADGLRPVISLSKDATVSGGDGTANSPYTIS